MLTYYCPSCWATLSEAEHRCSHCGYDLSAVAALPYEDKLIMALGHPVPERRAMAIEILGDLHSQKCLPRFGELLADSRADYYTLSAVVRALEKIPGHTSAELLGQARRHSSPLVRRAAQAAKDGV